MEGYENIANIAKDTEVTNTKIDTVTTVTIDPNPCEGTNCVKQKESIRECRMARCWYEWVRTSREDRQLREEKDKQRTRYDA